MSLRFDAVLLDRIRGCLIGGAVGDALGAPVEFMSLREITALVGERGVRDYLPVSFDGISGTGLITDDTQMTLFTVEGLIRLEARATVKGIGPATAVLQRAYWRWFDTQVNPGPIDGVDDGGLIREQWLYSRRAPGNTCLSALSATRAFDPFLPHGKGFDAIDYASLNNSKGCGTVMRAAPLGFLSSEELAWEVSCQAAGYTHGHPTGQHAAGALSVLIWHLVRGATVWDAVAMTIRYVQNVPRTSETQAALEAALRASVTGPPCAQMVESLGGGWIAEEALAIAVYAALAYPEATTVRDALALAVTHSGDSDSTGSICGNILGAAHGFTAIPADLIFRVEGRTTILQLAEDLWLELAAGTSPPLLIIKTDGSLLPGSSEPSLHDLDEWWDRYPGA